MKGSDVMKPSEEFLKAFANEEKRLAHEVAKVDPHKPNAYQQVIKLAREYSDYFDRNGQPMLAIEFREFIKGCFAKKVNASSTASLGIRELLQRAVDGFRP